MAFSAVVCNVVIASPGDVQIERNIVREVVHEWNVVNSSMRQAVLLPVGWETHSTPTMGDRPQALINSQVMKDGDLLIAVFWTRLGTPTGQASSGTVEEIEEHLKAGKPALIYFSSAPVAQDSIDQEQYHALKMFKEDCKKRGLLATYESATDFHNKVRQHLAVTINTNPYFKTLLHAVLPLGSEESQVEAPELPALSREARELLINATAGHGEVMVVGWMGGSAVQTNGKNFVEGGNPRSRAIWEEAVQELVNTGMLQAVGHKGEIFRVTRYGYEIADLLK